MSRRVEETRRTVAPIGGVPPPSSVAPSPSLRQVVSSFLVQAKASSQMPSGLVDDAVIVQDAAQLLLLNTSSKARLGVEMGRMSRVRESKPLSVSESDGRLSHSVIAPRYLHRLPDALANKGSGAGATATLRASASASTLLASSMGATAGAPPAALAGSAHLNPSKSTPALPEVIVPLGYRATLPPAFRNLVNGSGGGGGGGGGTTSRTQHAMTGRASGALSFSSLPSSAQSSRASVQRSLSSDSALATSPPAAAPPRGGLSFARDVGTAEESAPSCTASGDVSKSTAGVTNLNTTPAMTLSGGGVISRPTSGASVYSAATEATLGGGTRSGRRSRPSSSLSQRRGGHVVSPSALQHVDAQTQTSADETSALEDASDDAHARAGHEAGASARETSGSHDATASTLSAASPRSAANGDAAGDDSSPVSDVLHTAARSALAPLTILSDGGATRARGASMGDDTSRLVSTARAARSGSLGQPDALAAATTSATSAASHLNDVHEALRACVSTDARSANLLQLAQDTLYEQSQLVEKLEAQLEWRQRLLDFVKLAYHRDVFAIREHLFQLSTRRLHTDAEHQQHVQHQQYAGAAFAAGGAGATAGRTASAMPRPRVYSSGSAHGWTAAPAHPPIACITKADVGAAWDADAAAALGVRPDAHLSDTFLRATHASLLPNAADVASLWSPTALLPPDSSASLRELMKLFNMQSMITALDKSEVDRLRGVDVEHGQLKARFDAIVKTSQSLVERHSALSESSAELAAKMDACELERRRAVLDRSVMEARLEEMTEWRVRATENLEALQARVRLLEGENAALRMGGSNSGGGGGELPMHDTEAIATMHDTSPPPMDSDVASVGMHELAPPACDVEESAQRSSPPSAASLPSAATRSPSSPTTRSASPTRSPSVRSGAGSASSVREGGGSAPPPPALIASKRSGSPAAVAPAARVDASASGGGGGGGGRGGSPVQALLPPLAGGRRPSTSGGGSSSTGRSQTRRASTPGTAMLADTAGSDIGVEVLHGAGKAAGQW